MHTIEGSSVAFAKESTNTEYLLLQEDGGVEWRLLNLFPLKKNDGRKSHYCLGKPFAKKITIAERLKKCSVKKEEEFIPPKNQFLIQPQNVPPTGLHVRFHPSGSDDSVLPKLFALDEKKKKKTAILKQRADFLKSIKENEIKRREKKKRRKERRAGERTQRDKIDARTSAKKSEKHKEGSGDYMEKGKSRKKRKRE